MSGGPSVNIPYWLDSAREALDAVMALTRRSKKSDFHDAQAKLVDFEREARNFYKERAKLRAAIVNLALQFPDVCREVGEKQALIDAATGRQPWPSQQRN